jgi:hypothetical protein
MAVNAEAIRQGLLTETGVPARDSLTPLHGEEHCVFAVSPCSPSLSSWYDEGLFSSRLVRRGGGALLAARRKKSSRPFLVTGLVIIANRFLRCLGG